MTVTVKFDVRDYVQFLTGVDMQKAAIRGIRSGAMRAITVLHTYVDSADAVNTGAYKRAWKSSNQDYGAVIHNQKTYAPVIEGGRRAGSKRPPKDAIARWAQQKLGLSKAEAKSAAFPIARAIGRRGLKARNVLSSALPEMKKAVAKEVSHEISVEIGGG